jgi:hypothetical protein
MKITFERVCIFILIIVIIILIVEQIEEYSLQDDPKLMEIKTAIEPLFSKNIKYTGILDVINKRDIFNELTFYKGNKSYTINKEKVFLCLKDKQDNYYDMNTLIFVTLHEISHSLCDEIGHTAKFNKIFDELIKKAAEMKIYDPKQSIVQDYCPD